MKYVHILLLLIIAACGEQAAEPVVETNEAVIDPLFEFVESAQSGIDFSNDISDQAGVNYFQYINIFDGGGVSIGDINNDGLSDIYFTGQMVSNKLYLNKGGLVFEDITDKAGVAGDGWCTGVTMADVNGDGFLDIYIGRAFNDDNPTLRENLLFINNGDLTFSEAAAAYGVNDQGYATQSSFFDYDNDGDLDLYVGNHPRDDFLFETTNPQARYQKMFNPTIEESDKLFKNNGDGTFTDATVEAGVLNYAFLLGVITADLNQDGWVDIYTANDHQEPDFYYVNNGDGTFTNQAHQKMKHISNFAMGIDYGDFNNDGFVDYTVVDMMAKDNYRQKTQMKGMSVEQFIYLVENGFHTQYMRNTLQLNNGDGTFAEIGQLAGVDKTDWSWAVLMSDFDNDGLKDIYVSNGYRKDYRDKDFMNAFEAKVDSSLRGLIPPDVQSFADKAGSTKLVNYYFRNNGDLTFASEGAENGISQPSFSYGAAYGDLDNDGDLDLVVSNLDDKAFVYRNTADQTRNQNYLRIKLEGEGANRFGYGAKLSLHHEGLIQYQELSATRGFQSSVEPIVHFGLKDWTHATVEVLWPDGRSQTLEDVEPNQLLTLKQADAAQTSKESVAPIKMFIASTNSGIDFTHTENVFDDYGKEVLLPHKMSQFGPSLAIGDVNGDGNEDIFVGGALWQSGALFIQQSNGSFTQASVAAIEADKGQEDLGSLFFDADGDNDLDLYVVSGGSEVPTGSNLLQDRLYLNDGSGQFIKSEALPAITHSGSCVVAADYDGDGDQDLFIGGRVDPGRYPYPAKSYLLQNDGGQFTDVTQEIAPELLDLGMVSSAVWQDINGDDQLDLLLVGEWMPLTVFEQNNGQFKNSTADYGLENTNGWWNKLVAVDMDKDGDMDYVAGNYGLNSKFRVSEEEPLHVYCSDFDKSGSLDIVLGYYNDGTCFPVRGRQCSSEQMPGIKKKFPSYHEFGNASLQDVYGEDLEAALHYEAKTFASTYIEKTENGFELHPLPTEAQFSTVFGICHDDFDGDGNLDLLISGNFYSPEVETGQNDASIGVLLSGDGQGKLSAVPGIKTGFYADKDVRDMKLLKRADGTTLVIVANNDGPLQVFEWRGASGVAIN